jgi:hypothetical protein
MGEHVASTALALLVTGGVGFAIAQITGGEPKPLSEQIESIRGQAAAQGYYAVVNRSVDLRGTEAVSRLFVFRSRPATEESIAGSSDEIRIYDEKDKRLELEYRFQPEVDRTPYRFAVTGTGQFDDTDRDEIIGQYIHGFVDASVPYPVAVIWDELAQRYVLKSLLPGKTPLKDFDDPGAWEAVARQGYRRAILRDTKSESVVGVFGVDSFGLQRNPFPILAAAFTVKAACNACARLIQINAWSLDFEQPVPATYPCAGNEVFARVRQFVDPVVVWQKRAPRGGRYC